VHADGVAYDDCESNEAVRCVSAPVYDHSGRMTAAMSISVPIIRWSDERRSEWTALVQRGAADLSRRLGHRTGASVPAGAASG
jgi:DNA-binding IclR family transcriptional regulator